MESETVSDAIENEMFENLSGRFLDVDDIYSVLSSERTVWEQIPMGKKENVFFLVDNTQNSENRSRGKRSSFPDDCGVWDSKSASSNIRYFILRNNHLESVVLKDGLYGKQGRKTFTSINPQPNEECLFGLHRAYVSLKRCPSYKKRVSWCSKGPAELLNRALVEYIGNYPDSVSVHGNNKNNDGEYIRKHPVILDSVKQAVRFGKKCRQIYSDTLTENTEMAPRDLKQVQSIKYALESKTRNKAVGRNNSRNAADDIQTLIHNVHEHPLIQEIIHTKGKAPSIILYTENQMTDLVNTCKIGRAIIGVDRTVNLGPCYLTILVFKQPKLRRKKSQSSPIILGPILLHYDGDFRTYHSFFSHIRGRFDDIAILDIEIGVDDMIIGSDEEAALVKAIKLVFCDSEIIFCTRHLKENVRRRLGNTTGVDKKMMRHILDDIFGKNGLIESDDMFSFDEKTVTVAAKIENEQSSFIRYFKTKLVPILKDFVLNPHFSKTEFLPLAWTNKTCESLDYILKLSVYRKPNLIINLVDKIHKIVQLHYANTRLAFYGEGTFQLAESLISFRMPKVVWVSKTSAEQNDHFQKFLDHIETRIDKYLLSTDGKLTIITRTPKTVKKLGKLKRMRKAKAKTIPEKRRKVLD
ncbi:uncharacterized protein LOC141902919 isoform X1 [Tubulanus polymorphus]|uniref:uncharacterized protein LOC141902919 isoform X1 n=1 Tax=Tubulanus polymorphus TaxID=672921 RepID=UPI003DA55C72